MIHAMTGTDTEVGKTVATAVLAARSLSHGHSVAIYKPTQTGLGKTEPGDAQDVARWLGNPGQLSAFEGVRLRHPMAPVDAALCAGLDPDAVLPSLAQHVQQVGELAAVHDVVIIEGAGGLLVELTAAGETIADLAQAVGASLVVAARPDLGTLNHTALTLEACSTRGFTRGTLLLGSYPEHPGPLHQRNLANLRNMAAGHGWDFAGALPAGLLRDLSRCRAALHEAAATLAWPCPGPC
ncbi:dethiobiotin synthase [Glutamicibacter nicotianae]